MHNLVQQLDVGVNWPNNLLYKILDLGKQLAKLVHA